MADARYSSWRIQNHKTNCVILWSTGMYSGTPLQPNLWREVGFHTLENLWWLWLPEPTLEQVDDKWWSMGCTGRVVPVLLVSTGLISISPLPPPVEHYLVSHSPRQDQYLSHNRWPGCTPPPPHTRKPFHGYLNEAILSYLTPYWTISLSKIHQCQEATLWSAGKSTNALLPGHHLSAVEGSICAWGFHGWFTWLYPLLFHLNHCLYCQHAWSCCCCWS